MNKFFAFTPDLAVEGADASATAPEGCFAEAGLARGTLSGSSNLPLLALMLLGTLRRRHRRAGAAGRGR